MDSIFLMSATKKMMEINGIKNALLVMGTDMNKTVLSDFGGLTDEASAATPGELLISLDVENGNLVDKALEALNALLSSKDKDKTGEEISYPSLNLAARALTEANLAFISVPGEFAAREAKTALLLGYERVHLQRQRAASGRSRA